MKPEFAVLILWSAVLGSSPVVAAAREERPKIFEIPEKIEPPVEMVTGREAIEALVGNTVLIHSSGPDALYLRTDGTGVSQNDGPPRKREAIKWAISDAQGLCIVRANEEKMPDDANCFRVTLSSNEVSIWVPITGPDDAGAALLLEGTLVRNNPLKF